MLLKIAFRNVFRNKRRSALTLAAITLSIGFLLFGYTYFEGLSYNVIEDSIKQTGDIRVIHPEYEVRERMFSLSVPVTGFSELRDRLAGEPFVQSAAGRIKFGSFIDYNDSKERTIGIGIEPDKENGILNLQANIIQGRICAPDKKETVIGKELQKRLRLELGDTLTVFTSTASMSFTGVNLVVVGIFDMNATAFNKMYYLPLPITQELLDMPDEVTEILLKTDDYKKAAEYAADVRKNEYYSDGHLIQAWMEVGILSGIYPMLKSVLALISSLFLIVAVMVIANTMLMAVLERTTEIGLLMSMGIKRRGIVLLFLYEGAYLGLFGGMIGALLGSAAGLYLQEHGLRIGKIAEGMPITMRQVIYGQLTVENIILTIVLSVIVSIFAALLPALKGARMQPSEAMRVI